MRAAVVALVLLASAAAAAAPAGAATWCGTDLAASDRVPEAVSSNQIHVVYAYPSDGTDRFAALSSGIVTDLTAIDAWWRGQDPTRAPRFDLFAFPNCPADLSRLDLSRVQLPHNGAFFAPLNDSFARLAGDLSEAPFGFDDEYKKYLVYYDGAVEIPAVCGESSVQPEEGGSRAYSFVLLGSRCPQDLGAGSIQAAVAVHELTHNLGAVPAFGPPHPCPEDRGHTCEAENDLMYPFLRFGLADLVLDVGHDDYYAHSGFWWDVQDSAWLTHVGTPEHTLSVALTGSTGQGSVTSDRPGIGCPPACTITWEQGTAIELTAQAGPSSRFVGWGGSCTGSGACEVSMDAPKAVTARFALQVGLRVQLVRRLGGSGSVSGPAGISCPSACAARFDKGIRVTLRAKPARGSLFTGWTGACRGKGACTIRLDGDRTVRATFRRKT